jgi:hypothetical protein
LGLTNLAIKKWQFLIRNYVSSILSYLRVAFFAQDCTVGNDSSTIKLFGYYGDRISSNGVHLLFAPSTYNTVKSLLVEPSLPFSGIGDNSPIEIHASPPKIIWSLGRAENDWFGYQNGVWTGLHIDRITYLWVSVRKKINLKKPSYHISFCPNADTGNICDLVDCPTLIEAKNLAEWYYAEWLDVNHNFDVKIENLYPLAKRLEGRANGKCVGEGNGRNGD